MGNTNAAAAAASGVATPGSGGESPGFNSLVRASVTEQSDSSRSSLSVSASTPGAADPTAQAGPATAASFGASGPAGTPTGLLRPAAAGPPGGAADEQAGAGSGASVFNLGSYYAGGAPAGASGGREAAGPDVRLNGSRRSTSTSVDVWQPAGRKGEGRGGQREPPAPALRGLVTRPELALCLLTEVRGVLPLGECCPGGVLPCRVVQPTGLCLEGLALLQSVTCAAPCPARGQHVPCWWLKRY